MTHEETKALCIMLIGGGIVFALLCQFIAGAFSMMDFASRYPQPPKRPNTVEVP